MTFWQFPPVETGPINSPEFVNAFASDALKVMFVIGFLLYAIFAFVALRQIEVMRKTVITSLSPVIQIAGVAHFLFAIGMLIFAFIYL